VDDVITACFQAWNEADRQRGRFLLERSITAGAELDVPWAVAAKLM
jgi:hypothetical protein